MLRAWAGMRDGSDGEMVDVCEEEGRDSITGPGGSTDVYPACRAVAKEMRKV